MKYFLLILAASTLGLNAADSASWPQEAGPERTWVLPAQPMAAAYPEGKLPVAWNAVIGLGKAAVVVSARRVFAYGMYRAGTEAAQADDPGRMPVLEDIPGSNKVPGVSSATMPGEPPDADAREGLVGELLVRCLDATSGQPLWTVRMPDQTMVYLSNAAFPLAAPLVVNDRVLIHAPTGRLYALDAATGRLLWRQNLYDHGMKGWTWKQCNGASPVLVGDLAVISYQGRSEESTGRDTYPSRVRVTAFRLADGQPAWSTLLPFHIYRQHASSIGVLPGADGPAILVPCGSGTAAVDGRTGAIRWLFDATKAMAEVFQDAPSEFTGEAAAMYRNELAYPYANLAPVAWNGLVVDSTSIGHDCAASRTWCIDVSEAEPKLLWQTQDFVAFNEMQRSNMLIHAGRLYGFDARGGWKRGSNPVGISGRPIRPDAEKSFQCRDVRTGKLLWSTDVLDGPGYEWSPSRLILVGDRLITANRRGVTVSRLRDDGLDILGSLAVADKSPVVLSDPVFADGMLYVRQLLLMHRGRPLGLAAAAGASGSLLAIRLR